jgi:hypothetical protein
MTDEKKPGPGKRVSVLLMGGPEDGRVVTIDPDEEDGYTIVYTNGPDEGRHDYTYIALVGHEKIFALGVHDSVWLTIDEALLSEEAVYDRVLTHLTAYYARNRRREVQQPG